MTTTSIEWTDKVWNPVTGCSHVSEGCRNCYAEREWVRLSANPKTVYYERDFTDVRCHEDRLLEPFSWKKRQRVFVNSMSDLFHPAVPFEFIDKVFAVMGLAIRHTFQVLTKRPERMVEYLSQANISATASLGVQISIFSGELPPQNRCFIWPFPNVWLGVSVEDQKTADARIPKLLECPTAIRFVSYEPALGPVDFREWTPIPGFRCPHDGAVCHHECKTECWRADTCGKLSTPGALIDWVIAGGESGPQARPSHPDWFRQVRDQCQSAGVPFFFKQWGEYLPGELIAGDPRPEPWRQYQDGSQAWRIVEWRAASKAELQRVLFSKVGKKKAGRLLDGVEHNQFPGVERV